MALNDKIAHLALYNATTFKHAATFGTNDIINIDLSIGREGDIDGVVTVARNKDTAALLDSMGCLSHWARVGYGEVYPVFIESKSPPKDNDSVSIELRVKGFKQYADLVDVTPFYDSGIGVRHYDVDDKSVLLYFYAGNEHLLISKVLDNVHQTMRERGFDPAFLNYGNIYKSGVESSRYQVDALSYMCNATERTTLSDAFSDILGESGISYDVHTSQNLSDDFSFILDRSHTHNNSNRLQGAFSDVVVDLDSPSYANVAFAFAKSKNGVSKVVAKKNVLSNRIYATHAVEGITNSSISGAEARVKAKLDSVQKYTGFVRFKSYVELRIGEEIALPDEIVNLTGASIATIVTKNIEGTIYSYESVFDYDSNVKPLNPARKYILGNIEQLEDKARRLSKTGKGSGVRY